MADSFDQHPDFERIVRDYERHLDEGKAPDSEAFVRDVPHSEQETLRQRLESIEFARMFSGSLDLSGDSSDDLVEGASVTAAMSRYRFVETIARGGMGQVLRVRDRNLDRDLALKIILPRAAAKPGFARRFEREARITGKLQHPGVPPVVELGRLEGGAPFLTMKLVEGETLRDRLARRPTTDLQLDSFLPIFESIAQTVAYAHSRRIIHRDLKPANIMVGAFGEVQVMDWGMAKQLDEEATSAEATDWIRSEAPWPPTVPADDLESTHPGNRSTEDAGELTRAGSVLGTPAYMPPEQARGEVEALDARADVFALGAMLYELLTRQPPYRGASAAEIIEQARTGDLEVADSELQQSQVDPELVELTRRCLAADPAERPADASVVADSLSHYLESLRNQLEYERVQRVAAEVRSREERKRRVLWIVSTALALTVLLGAGLAWSWFQRERANKALEAQFEQRLVRRDVESLVGQAAELRDQQRWEAAGSLLENAERRLGTDPPEQLAQQVRLGQVDLRFAQRMHTVIFEGYSVGFGEYTDPAQMSRRFGMQGLHASAMNSYLDARFGISRHVAELSEDPELLEQVRKSEILTLLVSCLDDWAPDIEDRRVRADVLRLASQLDRDETRSAIRHAVISEDMDRVLALAEQAETGALSAETLWLLFKVPDWEQHRPRLLALLKLAARQYPGDFRLRMVSLFPLQYQADSPEYRLQFLEAATAAVALSPRNASAQYHYGTSQIAADNFENGAQAYLRVVAIDKHDLDAYAMAAMCLRNLGEDQEAVSVLKRCVKENPNRARSYGILGQLLLDLGKHREAESHLRRCLEILKSSPFEGEGEQYEFVLATCLLHLKRPDEAFKAYRAGRQEYPQAPVAPELARRFRDLKRHDLCHQVLTDQVAILKSHSPDWATAQYNLACSAAMAAVHNAADPPGQRSWRTKALAAMETLVAFATEQLGQPDNDPQQAKRLRDLVHSALDDPDLQTLRGTRLDGLDKNEQQAWQELWDRCRSLTPPDTSSSSKAK